MTLPSTAEVDAGQRYLLLADVSGYTSFLSGVEAATLRFLSA